MSAIPGWHAYFLGMCDMVAQRSRNPRTKVGCVVVGAAHEVRSTGYNGFPRAVQDLDSRWVRAEKDRWNVHAERNAVYNAARHGAALNGCTLYCSLLPCSECTKAIIQCGIVRVIIDGDRMRGYTANWLTPDERALVLALASEGGVQLWSFETEKGLLSVVD